MKTITCSQNVIVKMSSKNVTKMPNSAKCPFSGLKRSVKNVTFNDTKMPNGAVKNVWLVASKRSGNKF